MESPRPDNNKVRCLWEASSAYTADYSSGVYLRGLWPV